MNEQVTEAGPGKIANKVAAMEPLFLRPAKAARLLDVSRSKIYEMIHSGAKLRRSK